MMVTFVSQCEKKALKRTRRVLDAFANRIGDNTWQTVITDEGLKAVRKLLSKTASKSTAVSCHWIRTRARTDLLWVVGNKKQFNSQGLVPVNTTKVNILNSDWENNFKYASSIQIIATLAALFHDIGKSTIGFQQKLRAKPTFGDPYRHEWISLKMFLWLIEDCNNDSEWLQRLVNLSQYLECNPFNNGSLIKTDRDTACINKIPPLAQWIAWLISSHHRLPPLEKVFYTPAEKNRVRKEENKLKRKQSNFYRRVSAIDYWVKNPSAINEADNNHLDSFWQFNQLVIYSDAWQKNVRRWSNKALNDNELILLSERFQNNDPPNKSISDPLLLNLSRLCLMAGDHNYSSLAPDDKRRVSGSQSFENLIANTDRATGETKQMLDEHLLGVAKFTAEFARYLPAISTVLPSLKSHEELTKHTNVERFSWQNKAYEQAVKSQKEVEDNGFFCVNMASTGLGKTIGNSRIMYALANPKKGARFTIALGLRVLTLQTGTSLTKDLGLNEEQLAILVGGSAHKELYEYQKNDNGKNEGISNEKLTESYGSESEEDIVTEWINSDIDDRVLDDLNLGTIIENKKVRAMLAAPVVVCTVDHIIQASECKRGGRFIAPVLRLLSSDLVLDEPDDFNQEDLPALSRLVHLSGQLGSKVLLSSATLTPDLIEGLFKAYSAGREIYNKSQNKQKPNIVCMWCDENKVKTMQTNESKAFQKEHNKFITKRVEFLKQQAIRRMGRILPLNLNYEKNRKDAFFIDLSSEIMTEAKKLHDDHHAVDDGFGKKISVGLVRIANVKNIISLMLAFYQTQKKDDDVHIHLCCYHAKQLLVLRNNLEEKLDRILKRDEAGPKGILQHEEINNALILRKERNQIFIVIASPVAEVGRDHDYDWAIVEPSSLRSIIQLAGRVWRHRPNKIALQPNISILQYNIKSLMNNSSADQPVFTYPGFESSDDKLDTHDMKELMSESQLSKIDAVSRINKPKELMPKSSLSDLEHKVMSELMNNEQINFLNAYWRNEDTSLRFNTFLQSISEFRKGQAQEDWTIVPTEEGLDVYSSEQIKQQGLGNSNKQNKLIQSVDMPCHNTNITPWLNADLQSALQSLEGVHPDKNIKFLAVRYSNVSLENNDTGWLFNEILGFWRNK